MRITVTLGYDGTVLIDGENGMHGIFKPDRRTLTGAKHRNGENRCDTASTIKRYLNIGQQLKRVKDKIELEDDKGIFNKINAVEYYQHCKRCYYAVTVPVTVLAGAAKLLERK